MTNLFDEIETFLANGGEPPEPTPQERMEAALSELAQAMHPIIDAFMEFVRAIGDMFARAFHKLNEWLTNFVVEMRRIQLYHRLRGVRLPPIMAMWLARHMPVSWLPEYASALGP